MSSNSTSLSGGNLVDDLPLARHIEAVWEPHGALGPAPISTLEHRKLTIKRTSDLTLPATYVGVLDCIGRLRMRQISNKIVDEIMISSRLQIITEGRKPSCVFSFF